MANVPNPYEKYHEDELILRDHLAIDRTELANERTFLAYIRTALAFGVVGGSFLKFFDSYALRAAGGVSAIFGTVLLIYGIMRFRAMSKKIAAGRFHGK